MKALTIKQPFAGLIAGGFKTVEVRSRYTARRGDVLICSGATPHSIEAFMPNELCIEKNRLNYSAWMGARLAISQHESLQLFGHAICVAELWKVSVPCISDSFETRIICPKGHLGWHFRNVRLIEPFPVKGQLGFFNVPDEKINILYDESEADWASHMLDLTLGSQGF